MLRAVALAPELAARGVERDREDPGLDRAARGVVAARREPHARERLLQPLLGERALPAEPEQHAEHRPLVAAVEQREGVPVAVGHALDQRVVAGRGERHEARGSARARRSSRRLAGPAAETAGRRSCSRRSWFESARPAGPVSAGTTGGAIRGLHPTGPDQTTLGPETTRATTRLWAAELAVMQQLSRRSGRPVRPQSGSSSCFGSGRKKLAAKPTTHSGETRRARPTSASFSAGEAPGMKLTSVVVSERRRGADHAAADVRGEALARAPQVRRVDARQVVPPEAELRHGHEAAQEDAPLEPRRRSRPSAATNTSGSRTRPGHLEHAQQARGAATIATARNASSTRPTRPPVSCQTWTALTIFCCAGRARSLDLGESGHDPRHLLDRAERDAVAAREQQRRDDRGALQLALRRSPPRLGRFSVPASFFSRHAGDSGRNGRIRISGSAGITPEIERVAPGLRGRRGSPAASRHSGRRGSRRRSPSARRPTRTPASSRAPPRAGAARGTARPARRRPRRTRRRRRRRSCSGRTAATPADVAKPAASAENA